MERRKRSWLTWGEKVELFEQIRREYEFGVGTIQGVARKLGVHRRMVREALRSAVPPEEKPPRPPHNVGRWRRRRPSNGSQSQLPKAQATASPFWA